MTPSPPVIDGIHTYAGAKLSLFGSHSLLISEAAVIQVEELLHSVLKANRNTGLIYWMQGGINVYFGTCVSKNS